MSKRILIVTFALALTIGLLVTPADARLIADGSSSYAFQATDDLGLPIALTSAGNADGKANNKEDGCDEQQVPNGKKKKTPSGVCYDPIHIGGSGS